MRKLKINTPKVKGTIYAECGDGYIVLTTHKAEDRDSKSQLLINGKPYKFSTHARVVNVVKVYNEETGDYDQLPKTKQYLEVKFDHSIYAFNQDSYCGSTRYHHLLKECLKPEILKLASDAAFIESGRIKRLKLSIGHCRRRIREAEEKIKWEKKDIARMQSYIKNPALQKQDKETL